LPVNARRWVLADNKAAKHPSNGDQLHYLPSAIQNSTL
jgi:hypothetical protein